MSFDPPSTTRTLSWETLVDDCQKTTNSLTMQNGQQPWQGILAVTRGGLIPATLVARILDIRILETVGVRAYSSDMPHAAFLAVPQICKAPSCDLGTGQGWLVIDDLTDTGATFIALRKRWPAAHYAAPYAKPQGVPHADTVGVHVPQNVWLIFPWETLEIKV